MKGAKLPTATAEAAGEEWLLGEAHRVFEKYARSGLKGGKAKKVNPSVKYLNKAMLESLMQAMVRACLSSLLLSPLPLLSRWAVVRFARSAVHGAADSLHDKGEDRRVCHRQFQAVRHRQEWLPLVG